MGLVSIFIRTHFLAFNNFQSAIHQPPPTETTMIPRRRPLLFTLGTLLLSFLQKVSTRFHIFRNPKGKNAKILCAIEHQMLTLLSFFDDHILVFEDLIETLFPSSSRFFDKIDEFIRSSESLPPKFEDFMDHDVPKIMQRVPFLDRFFHKDEKEIVIDITCHGYRIEPENSSQEDDVVDSSKTTCEFSCEFSEEEEMVEKWSEENDEDDLKKEKNNMEDSNGDLYSATTEINNEEILKSEDPIYELFEAGWHMSPRALSGTSSILKD
ncbi:uncharacterized protein LOC111914370 [Lactuca sativa]|uniref:uncharacterized protein LOC111914370 n=1 Tax=Lactuca sativa TaxID=4236 RepID=UPI000CD9E15D|nr:uncharacterized protein LOC111914370 [Lactuca sativa]